VFPLQKSRDAAGGPSGGSLAAIGSGGGVASGGGPSASGSAVGSSLTPGLTPGGHGGHLGEEPSDLEELEQFARTFKQRRIKLGFTQVKHLDGRRGGGRKNERENERKNERENERKKE